MKDLLPSAMRPHSVVLVIAPPHSGKTALVQQLVAEISKRGQLVQITNLEEASALEAGIDGKLIVVDGPKMRQLRNGSLRQMFLRQGKVDSALIATATSLLELSQLEFHNADYLCVKDLPHQELRKLSKVARYSIKQLVKLTRDQWLVFDRREGQVYVCPVPLPTLPPCPSPSPEVAEPEAAEPVPEQKAAPVEQGWFDYMTSWFY